MSIFHAVKERRNSREQRGVFLGKCFSFGCEWIYIQIILESVKKNAVLTNSSSLLAYPPPKGKAVNGWMKTVTSDRHPPL